MSRLQTVRENWTEITTKLLRDKQELAHFLRFSAKMYKQSFSDAVLIYQQNPSATKVATLETWNKLGRLVNKGEHSIAVFGEDSKCKHLFDVSQTNGKRVPELWKLTEDLSADLTAVINEKYGKDCKNIQETIAAVAVDNIKSRLPDMQYAVGQMKLSEKDITAYQQSIVSAVRFVIANRCELDSDMKISGGINLNAADMFKDSRDLIRFCNIVNQSAKDALLEMEREIVNILKQRRERSNDIQIKVNDKKPKAEPVSKNPNVIGNTPYDELGEKGQLEYITKLKTRHALNIAKQLDEDGVKFSGLKKGTVTTITINKADKEKYEAAVARVKESYSKSKEQTAEPLADKTPVPKPAPKKPVNIAADIDKAISDSNYELYRYNLKQAAATVIEEHGAEKVSRTLAEYISRHDYDGRISEKNKEWAKSFDIPENRYPPVFHTHPAVLDGFITEAQVQIKALENSVSQPELPDVCKDKFLLPVERVELRDDHRGIPETKYYDSSVNEYFVDGIGWLDNAAYDREQKFSELSPKDFYAKVTQINCSYVDTEGRTGQIDVSKKDYDILTEKTYSKENSEAYKAAKDKLEQRKREAGIKPKPVEYYAVRQTADRKFAVATISADGLVTVAKAGIATIEEAKKALLDIYKSKQSTVKCEFVHPQTLDEKSAEIYRSQTKELPAVTYRITPNPDKKSPDTHILQEYVKNGDDTYAIGKVMAKGDYEKCNSRLANLINPPKIEAPVKTFEIYQIRRVDETRDVRFEPYERLLKAGLKPDFKTYDKMYEADVSMLSGKSTGEKLESAFYVFNQERPEDFKGHSLSVSDVVVLDDTAYYVDSVGFKPLKDFIPLEIQQSRFLDTLPQTLKGIPDNAVELEAVSDKALKLNIPPEIIREACDMVNGGESLDNMANAYEEKFTEKNAPAEEAPEIEKPKPQKKPKL